MPFAELTDLRCHYLLRGSGEPVLLIPGLGSTTEDWGPALESVSRSFTIILPDLRGIGRSEAKRQPLSLQHYSADLIELLDHLQLDRVHVVGLSLGGIIAQRFATDHPQRIRRLVLVSCAHRFGPRLRAMATLVGHMLRYFPITLYARAMVLLGTSPVFIDADPQYLDRKEVEVRRNRLSRKAVARQLRCLAVSDPRLNEHDRITAPTLVLAGEYDSLIPHYYGQRISEAIANSRFMMIRGAGHNPFNECPEKVLSVIVEFLNEPVNKETEPTNSATDSEAA